MNNEHNKTKNDYGCLVNKESLTVAKVTEYYENIIKIMPGNVFWLDKNCITIGCNQNVVDMFGLNSADEFKGLTFEEMGKIGNWSPEVTQSFKSDSMEVIRTGIAILNREEPPIRHANGKVLHFLASRVPIFDSNGLVVGIVGISVDISERKKLEAELIEAKQATEIANAELLQANQTILAKNLAQAQFIQNMQHDFRTPASGVWSMLNNLAEAETNPDKKKSLSLARDASKQIYDIFNEIIDFEKIERTKIPVICKKFNLETIIKNVFELHRPAALVKQLLFDYSIDPNIPPVVSGDEYRVNRILLNLVANAIKFTSSGKVSIAAKLGKVNDKEIIVQLEIADTGMGISVDQQTLIYEKFNRLTPSNAGLYRGIGLGLRIVKQFVEEIGGEIELQSEINKGSTFYVTCPFKKPLLNVIHNVLPVNFQDNKLVADTKFNVNESPEDVPKINPSAPHTPHILLVEDNQLARLGAMQILQSANCNVSAAEDVAQAKQLLHANKFDLVISDLGLPDGSGNDIVLAVKSDQQSLNYNTPFLALTAHDDTENLTAAKNAGFLLVMTKPLLKNKVPELLDKYIKKI